MTTTDDELLALAEKAFALFFTTDVVWHHAAVGEMRKACHPATIKRLIQRSKRLEEAESKLASIYATCEGAGGHYEDAIEAIMALSHEERGA